MRRYTVFESMLTFDFAFFHLDDDLLPIDSRKGLYMVRFSISRALVGIMTSNAFFRALGLFALQRDHGFSKEAQKDYFSRLIYRSHLLAQPTLNQSMLTGNVMAAIRKKPPHFRPLDVVTWCANDRKTPSCTSNPRSSHKTEYDVDGILY